MLLREEEEFNLGDYAQKVGDMFAKGLYTVGRGVPQLGTGMVDLFGLPFTMSGMIKPENVIGSTDYATKLGLLPKQSEGIFGQSSAGDFSEALLGSLNPTAAAKTAILATAPFLKDYVQQFGGQGKNIFQQGADLSKDMNAPMLSKAYGSGGGGGLLSNFQDLDELGYFSPTLRSVENINQPSGTGEQFLNMLQKDSAVKKEELDWIGLPEFLKSKENFTKEEVMDYVRDNTINLKREKLIDQSVLGKRFDELDEATQNQLYTGYADLNEYMRPYLDLGFAQEDAFQLGRFEQVANFARNNVVFDDIVFDQKEAKHAFDEFMHMSRGQRDEHSPEIKNIFGTDPVQFDPELNKLTLGDYPIRDAVNNLRNIITPPYKKPISVFIPLPPDLKKAMAIEDSPVQANNNLINKMPFDLVKFGGGNLFDKAFRNVYDKQGRLEGFEMQTHQHLHTAPRRAKKWLTKLSEWEKGFDREITNEEYANWLDQNNIEIAEEVDVIMNISVAPYIAKDVVQNDMVSYSLHANNPKGAYVVQGLGKDFTGEPQDKKIFYVHNYGGFAAEEINLRDVDEEVFVKREGEGDIIDMHDQLVFSEAANYVEDPRAELNDLGHIRNIEGFPVLTEQITGGFADPRVHGFPEYTFKQKDTKEAPAFKVYGYRIDPSNTPTGDKQAEVIAQTQTGGHFTVPPRVMGVADADESGTYALAHLRFTDRVVDEFPNDKALFVEEIQSDYHKSARGQKGAYQSQKELLQKKETEYGEAVYELDLLQDEIIAQKEQNTKTRVADMSDEELQKAKQQYFADIKSLEENYVEQNKDIVVSTLKDALNAQLLYSQAFDDVVDKEPIKAVLKQLSNKDVTAEQILDILTAQTKLPKEKSIFRDSERASNPQSSVELLDYLLTLQETIAETKLKNLKPDAPFKKEHELGVKETLKLAVEEGYDRAVFPTHESVASHSPEAPANVYKQANAFIKKYAKKIGAKVETVTMKNDDGKEYKFLSIPITPELKEFIQKIGQPIVQQQNNMGIFAMNEPLSMGIM
jgi:hypothetical protein